MGKISFDGTEIVETAFPFNTGHIYSRDESLIVGDGGQEGKYIRLWKWNGTQYEAPRALCGHFSTLKGQSSHPHPVITPDGKHVLFTSDFTGYDQLYLAEIPDDLNDLPLLDTLSSL
jgi:oligogalacturonide lyase